MALSFSAMLETYRISPIAGFAMEKPSPTKFADPDLNAWLEIGNRIPALLKQSTRDRDLLRAEARALPILEAEKLESIEEYQLAYVILTCLAQAYIWGNVEAGEEPCQVLPPSISIPLLEISKDLEIQPGHCYSSGSIWVYTEDPVSGEEKAVCSITGTPDEDHFNLTTHRVERIAGKALIQGLMAARFAGQSNSKGAAKCLNIVADTFKDCKAALEKMKEGCDPDVFYSKIRPYLAGSNVRNSSSLLCSFLDPQCSYLPLVV
jgi:indoleamine 2,3-dioxygenase